MAQTDRQTDGRTGKTCNATYRTATYEDKEAKLRCNIDNVF